MNSDMHFYMLLDIMYEMLIKTKSVGEVINEMYVLYPLHFLCKSYGFWEIK